VVIDRPALHLVDGRAVSMVYVQGGMTMEFDIELTREPDGGYVVSVPSFPGCHTQGDSREEAIANAREAIASHLEALRALGEPLPAVELERVAVEV
jgi:predicted RNase H-like HicB family nuclease